MMASDNTISADETCRRGRAMLPKAWPFEPSRLHPSWCYRSRLPHKRSYRYRSPAAQRSDIWPCNRGDRRAERGRPAAAVVLLAGGNGILGLAPDGSITNGLSNNFLVRSRQLFADHNLYVAVLDAPSDHATPPGLTSAYRVGLEHAQDIGVVLANVRMRAGVPTWLVGTSSGALSVANTATRTLTSPRASPAGIVLTSSLTHKSLGCPVPVTDVLLQSIRLPTLIVSHRDDACACSPAVDANGLLARYSRMRSLS